MAPFEEEESTVPSKQCAVSMKTMTNLHELNCIRINVILRIWIAATFFNYQTLREYMLKIFSNNEQLFNRFKNMVSKSWQFVIIGVYAFRSKLC